MEQLEKRTIFERHYHQFEKKKKFQKFNLFTLLYKRFKQCISFFLCIKNLKKKKTNLKGGTLQYCPNKCVKSKNLAAAGFFYTNTIDHVNKCYTEICRWLNVNIGEVDANI